MIETKHNAVVCCQAGRRLSFSELMISVPQFTYQCRSDDSDNFILHCKYIFKVSIIAIRPYMRTCSGID